MKICTKCNQLKQLNDFRNRAASSDGLSSRCKQCLSAQDKEDYQRNPDRQKRIRESNDARRLVGQQFLRTCLEHSPCVDCGESDADLLEYDHVLGTKIAGIGEMVRDCYSVEVIMEEMDKCVVRCLHCHRKCTIKQHGWYGWMN